jgi:hypothetical protein
MTEKKVKEVPPLNLDYIKALTFMTSARSPNFNSDPQDTSRNRHGMASSITLTVEKEIGKYNFDHDIETDYEAEKSLEMLYDIQLADMVAKKTTG